MWKNIGDLEVREDLAAQILSCIERKQAFCLMGPPGAGKTMLAQRLHHLLPPLSKEEAFEVQMIHAWVWDRRYVPFQGRPFRAPHHTVSDAGLVGSLEKLKPCKVFEYGKIWQLPARWRVGLGEVSLAHHGVLLLDELPEFRRAALRQLLTVVHHGVHHFNREGLLLRLPARPTIVVGASNPCPCGWAGQARGSCRCGPETIKRYQERIPAEFERIDIVGKLRAPGSKLAFGVRA